MNKKNIYQRGEVFVSPQTSSCFEMFGISPKPMALMLKYVYFDFSPFGLSNKKVSSFKDLLASIHSFCEFKKFEILPPWIARDATFAVQYLHHNGTAHRDLKTFNVLASNQQFLRLV